jgi:hypothetical protein
VITKAKTKYPGITKITTASGDIKYRLIVAVGKRPDGRWVQECYTFPNLTAARKKQTEIKRSRDRGTLVNATASPSMSCAGAGSPHGTTCGR